MTEKSENKSSKKKKVSISNVLRSIRKALLRFLLFVFASILIVSLSFIFLSQTKIFRSWFYGKVLSIVNEELEGRIEASDIKISPFEGIQIWDLKIIAADDTLAAIDKININYAFNPLLSKYLYIKSITVENPRFKLIRDSNDSSWNFTHLVKPSNDTTTADKLDWVFDIQNFLLKNGSLVISDPLSLDNNLAFSPTNLTLKHLNLLIQAKADLAKEKYFVDLKKFMFYEKSTDFDVRDIAFRINVDTTKLSLSGGSIRTNYFKSEFNINADYFNVFSISDSSFETALFNLDFKSEYLNLLAVSKFIPDFPVIKEELEFSLHVTGNSKKVNIKKLDINKAGSNILLEASVENPLVEDQIKYSVKINNSNLYETDFASIKRAFDISSFDLGNTEIKYLFAEGDKESIKSKININTQFGSVKGNASINLKSEDFLAELLFKQVNIAEIIKDKSLVSNLTGKLKVAGKGFNQDRIDAEIDLMLGESELSDFSIKSMKLLSRVNPNLNIELDTFDISLNNIYSDSLIKNYSKVSRLSTHGNLNLSDFSKPIYDLNISFKEFNFASLLKFNLAPQLLDADISVSGMGFQPDSIEAKLKADILTCMFGNRALLPFSIELVAERFGARGRQILLNSELFQLELVGEYQVEDFISLAEYQIGELVTHINRKVFAFDYDTAELLNKEFQFRKQSTPKTYTMDLTAKLKDITPIGIAVGQPNLYGKAELAIYVDVSDTKSIIDLRKLNIESFQYKDRIADINISPTEFTGYIRMDIVDSLPVFNRINLTMDALSNIYVNELNFDRPNIWFDYRGEKIDFKIKSTINDLFYTDSKGHLDFNQSNYKLTLDTSNIAVSKDYIWNSKVPIKITADKNGLTFDELIYSRMNSETIELTGSVNSDYADNIHIEVLNFPLNQIESYLPDAQKKFAANLKGSLKKVSLSITDSLLSPKIECDFETENIYSENTYIGILKGKAKYEDRLLIGDIHLADSLEKKELLRIDINSLPIDLALKSGGKRIHGDAPIDISAKAFNLPLEIVNPFLPDVISDMKGIADAEFKIIGDRDNVDYLGTITAKRSRFLANVNNLYYNVTGTINIDNENISFDNIYAENDADDLRNGKAKVDGSIVFRDFTIEAFDLSIISNSIKLLGMKSIKTMPNLYGDFVVASGDKPIKFSGSFEKPFLSGEIDIQRAKIYMPSTDSKDKIARSLFKYEVKGNNFKVEYITKDSLLNYMVNNGNTDTLIVENNKPEIKEEVDFADLINYDIFVKFINPMEVYMDLGGQLGQIFAVVSTKVPGTKLNYIVDPEQRKTMIIGDLVLKDNSTMTFIKPFKITGDISFHTGSMDNPSLNLKAEYSGRTTREDYIRNYVVNIYIRGNKKRQIITFDYLLDDEPARGDTAKIREDALFLLMFGLTKSEFEQPSSGGSATDALSSGGSQYVASVLSRSVTEMLSGTGFISSADIDLQGGSFQNAKLKLSGQIFGMTWNVGGSIADIMNGYEFTAEVPLVLLLNEEYLRSVFMSFSTSYNPAQNISRNQKNWEVKLKFGNDF